MATDNKDLSAQLTQQGAAMTPLGFEKNMANWFARNKKRLVTMAGSDEEAKRLLTAMVHVCSSNSYLIKCSQESLGLCLMNSAALGLYPGAMQEVAYVPFKGQATFIPQYQGLCKLAYQSGMVTSINSDVVYEGDQFDYEKGSQPYLRHRYGSERDKVIFAWTVIKMKGGGDPIIEVMPAEGKNSIDSIRRRSPAASRGGSPWDTDFEEMAKKTVLRRALKAIPKSPKLAEAIQFDNVADRPDLENKPLVDIDVTDIIKEDQDGKDN